MAQTNFTPISLYYSATAAVVPTAGNLVAGELALNTNDGKLYYKDSAGVVQVLATKASSSGSFGALTATSITDSGLTSGRVTYATTGGLLTDSANLKFNGTDLQLSAGNIYWDVPGVRYIANVGDGSSNLNIQSRGNTIFSYGGATVGAGTEAMRIDSSGNVGIGTSSPNKISASTVLSINTGAAANYAGFDISTADAVRTALYANNAGSFLETRTSTPLVFGTNTTERMRITSAGNVLPGSDSAYSLGASGSRWLTVNAATFSEGGATNNFITTSSTTTLFNSGSTWQQAAFYTAGTERMRIDSSGNVGIGTSSPSYKLQVQNTVAATTTVQDIAYFVAESSGTTTSGFGARLLLGTENANGNVWPAGIAALNSSGGSNLSELGFYTATSGPTLNERMRITSAGNVLIGDSTLTGVRFGSIAAANNHAGLFNSQSAGWATLLVVNSGSPTVEMIAFRTSNGGSTVGSVTYNGSVTLYNTTSDYRLKNVIGAVNNAGERLDALEPIEYDFKTGGRTRGFLAHKFAEVYPNSVSGEKDAVDENGKPVYQAMQASTSEVMADLIAEIQSLRKRVAQLEAK